MCKLVSILADRMHNINWFLSRNPKQKAVKWMWNGYQHRTSNRKARDLI
jgi:hypothetical protein